MRALVLALCLASAAAITTTCDPSSCPAGCSCSCTVNSCPTLNPTKVPTTLSPTPNPTTPAPTHMPTATPTATPTSPAGRCCFVDANTSYCLMVDQDDCEGGGDRRRVAPAPRDFLDFVKQKKGRRNVNVGAFDGEWDANKACNTNPCEGVPVTVGSSNFSVDVSHAGLSANGGISLTPIATEGDLPTGSQAKLPGEVILAFDVDRFEGATELDSDFLAVPNYIWVKIQSSDPEIEDPEAVRVIRWDEDDQEWKDIQEECAGRIQSVDFVLDTTPTPNVLWVPLCHTSSFVLTTADDGDDKDDKKGKTKKAKTPSEGKTSKAKSGKKAKAGKKAAATGIAVGAAIGGAAVLAVGAFGVYKCTSKKNKTQKKAAKGARASAAAPVVNLPTGAMTV